MVGLNNIPHDTNWAHIAITRLGAGRDTRYQISPSEAKQESEEAIGVTTPIASTKYTRGKYGKLVRH